MTTTVKVMARAWGALVNVSRATEGEVGHNITEEDVELGPHEDRSFDIAEGETVSFKVTHGAEPQPEPETEVMTAQDEGFTDPATGTDPSQVPGQAENDALLGKSKTKRSFGQDDTAPATDA